MYRINKQQPLRCAHSIGNTAGQLILNQQTTGIFRKLISENLSQLNVYSRISLFHYGNKTIPFSADTTNHEL